MAGPSKRRVIPSEELSEFQRWQFGSLIDPNPRASLIKPPPPVPEELPPEPEVEIEPIVEADYPEEEQLPYPTAEEIEAIEQQAHQEGYQAGLEQGRQAGDAEIKTLQNLLGGLTEACAGIEKTLAEQVLDLSIVIARQVLRDELAVNRTHLVVAIREALAALPAVKPSARLLLNPEDLPVVSNYLSGDLPADIWRLQADPDLSPGSCRIETSSTSIDLTLESRWQSIMRVLGREQRADLAWEKDNKSIDPVFPEIPLAGLDEPQ